MLSSIRWNKRVIHSWAFERIYDLAYILWTSRPPHVIAATEDLARYAAPVRDLDITGNKVLTGGE